jgi:hypothetical protein
LSSAAVGRCPQHRFSGFACGSSSAKCAKNHFGSLPGLNVRPWFRVECTAAPGTEIGGIHDGGRKRMRSLATALSAVLTVCLATTVVTATTTTVATAAVSTERAAGLVTQETVIGYFRLQKSDSTGAVAETLLFCGTVQHGSGPTEVVGYGSVSNPDAACRELAAVDGDFAKLLVHPTWLVPARSAPVTVVASGAWFTRGRVSYRHNFRNTGEAARITGDIFGF